MPHAFFLQCRYRGGLRRNEFQRHPVDAIAQPGWRGAVVENVALMPAASGAMDFRSRHEELPIGFRLDRGLLDRLPKAGPAGSALEFVLG